MQDSSLMHDSAGDALLDMMWDAAAETDKQQQRVHWTTPSWPPRSIPSASF